MPKDCFSCFIFTWVGVCEVHPEFCFVFSNGFFPGYNAFYVGYTAIVLQRCTLFYVSWFGSYGPHAAPPLSPSVCVRGFLSVLVKKIVFFFRTD